MLALLVPGVGMGGSPATSAAPAKSLCATGSRGNTLAATGSVNG